MPKTLKYQWSLGNNYLAGITAGDWWRLLRGNQFGVDPAYWHRAALVTLLSGINSFHRKREMALYHELIGATRVAPPVFVIGHWRSGTTHLHNLLAQDTEWFAFANTYQVVNPHTFLTTEEKNIRRFAWMVPKTRPMDAMELNFQSPQEDEFAPCLMSLRSPYLGISFPRNADKYDRYLTFDGVPQCEVDEWKCSFEWFLKKLTLKYRRPLVLKSPTHTARIRLLLEIFPDAKFIHIHRNPYQVYQSTRHYHDTAAWYTYLQKPDLGGVEERIIRRYRDLHDAYFAQKHLIPSENFHELRFDDLERDPVGEMRLIYEKLDLGGFDSFEPHLKDYLNSIQDYQKNSFIHLNENERKIIATAWKREFEAWNYPT